MPPEPSAWLIERPSRRTCFLSGPSAATRVAANDKPGRETLCRYILRPPLANDRLHILPDGNVKLEFKRPWSDDYASHCTSFSLVDAIRCSFCPDA